MVVMAMVSDAQVANLARVIEKCKLDGRDSDGTRRLSSQSCACEALKTVNWMVALAMVLDV